MPVHVVRTHEMDKDRTASTPRGGVTVLVITLRTCDVTRPCGHASRLASTLRRDDEMRPWHVVVCHWGSYLVNWVGLR